MIIKVNKHDIEINEDEKINTRELNISKCYFEFAPDYDKYPRLVKEALFTIGDKTYKKVIIDNQCDYPTEVLENNGKVMIGVCAYEIIDNEFVIRYSPTPKNIYISLGSCICKISNSKITPNELEQYKQILNDSINEFNKRLASVTDNMSDMAEVVDSRGGYTTLGLRLDKKPYYFNNIESMVNAKLKAGDYAITSGYYDYNDGGNGTYLIRIRYDTDIEDGGTIHIINDNLVAELIRYNEINVKQFGAKGDGITDDTQSFKKAIKYLKSLYSYENVFNNILTLNIPHGRYVISETLEIPIIIKINVLSDVLILSNVENAPTFWINSSNLTNRNNGYNIIRQQSFNIAKTIGGTGIFCIERNTTDDNEKDVNDLSATSVAIEIGDRTYNPNSLTCARSSYDNIAISGFSTAIQLNSINTYIITFNNIKLERNRYDFVYGKNDMIRENSGEKIVFNDCVFAQSYNAYINNAGGHFTFNDCSFDFNGNFILCNKSCHLVFNTNHFEAVGHSQNGIIDANKENCIGFGTIIYNNYNSLSKTDVTAVAINNPDFYLKESNKILIPRYQSIFDGNYSNLVVNFNNLQFFEEGGYCYENAFMNTRNVQINHFNTTIKNSTMPTVPFNILDNAGMLNNIDNEVNSLTNLENHYQISTQNVAGVSVDTTNKIFEKSLLFIVQNKNYSNIRRRFKNVYGNKFTTACFFKTNLQGDNDNLDSFYIQINISFYNKNNIYVSAPVDLYLDSNYHVFKDPNSDWNLIKPCVVDIPMATDEILISYSFTYKNNENITIPASGNIWIGGIVIEELL